MSETPPPPAGSAPPPGGRTRRPPTIDLVATEVAGAGNADPDPAVDDPRPAVPPAPDAAGEAPEHDTSSAGATHPGEAAAGEPPGPPPLRPAWRPVVIPALGAGIAGAVAVLAVLWIAGLLPPQDGGANGLEARLARLERQVGEIAARAPAPGADARALDDIKSRLARLEAAPAPPRPDAGDPAVANRIAAVEGEVKALAESVGILGRRSDEATAAAREARQRADASVAAVAELPKTPAAPPIERSELDGLAARVTAVERSEKTVEAADRSLRLALAAAALRAAVESGGGFAAELATVKSLGADPRLTAPLEAFATAGVPSAAALARELSAMAPALLAAAGAPPREGGFLERLQANAEKLVRIRPLEETVGSDPAAIAARIESRAAQTDIAGALAELAKLPEPMRASAATWISKAQARVAALEAARRLAADALAGLGK